MCCTARQGWRCRVCNMRPSRWCCGPVWVQGMLEAVGGACEGGTRNPTPFPKVGGVLCVLVGRGKEKGRTGRA